MKRLSAEIAFISTTQCGVITYLGEISENIEGRIGRGGGRKIGQNVSQIASGVTDDHNTIIILIIF